MATTPESAADPLDTRPQSSRAETAFDRSTTAATRQDSSNCPDEIIYIPETIETRVKPPNFDVKEAYVTTSTSSVENKTNHDQTPTKEIPVSGFFSKIASTVQGIFRWRKLAVKNTRVTPNSGSFFVDAGRANTRDGAKKTPPNDNISMNRLNMTSEQSTQMQSSQIFNQSFSSGLFQSDGAKNFQENEQYPSYESHIYSVNAAGNPIPITIENDRNDDTTDDSSSEMSDDSKENGSRIRLTVNTKTKFDIKRFSKETWRRTYHPESMFMYCWLLLITLIVLYNAWIIPLRAGFITDIQTPWQSVWFAVDAICDVIFIVDIFIKFRTRFVKHGVYVHDRKTLNHHYAREWTIFLDFASVFPTDLFFIQTINPYLRMNRMLRVYRVYTFYRMVELKTWWPNVLRLINLVHTVVIIVHYNACIYFSSCLANGYGRTLSSWAYPDPSIYPNYSPLTRRYTHSFYWSLQELSLIGGRAIPEEDWQYVYTIYLNIIGIAFAAYIIGYVTMILLGRYSEKFEFERSMESTRKYMKRRKLPKELRRRVEEFYSHMWNKAEFGHLDEDKMLRHLPLSIKEEIAYQGNYNALKELPDLSQCDPSILKSLVSKLKRRTYLPGQFVYKSGDAGTEMFIVGEGVLQVIRERDGQVTGAREGDIFGEMNIFNLRNNHRRTTDVVSCGYSELYVLTANDAHETLQQYPRVMNVILQQAKREKVRQRRKMSQNFYKRRSHQRYFPTNTSTESFKLINSPSNVQLSIKESSVALRNAGTSNNSSSKSFKVINDSPDSGMPSSGGRRKRSEAELSGISVLHNDILEETMPPELAEKLAVTYQKNLKSFQKSLDDIWFNELISLKQQLANAEYERDDKAREINLLRHRAGAEKQGKSLAKSNDSTPPIAEEITGSTEEVSKPDTTASKVSRSSRGKLENPKWQTNVKFRPTTNSSRRRTFLPTQGISNTNLKSSAAGSGASSVAT